MKTNKHFSTFIFTAALLILTACEMAIPPFIGPTDRPDNGETPVVPPVEAPDTIGWNVPAEAITVSEARDICAALESGATTGTKYYVMGYVKKIHNKHADGVSNYGNAQFYMEEVKGANSSDDFMAFQVYGPNSKKLSDPNAVAVGDFVVIYGELTNYSGTYETTGKGAAYIWKSTNPLLNEQAKPEEPEVLVIPEEAKAWNIPAEAIDVMKAREICAALAAGDSTDKPYYVMGYVKKLHANHASGITGYGNAQFYMENIKGKNSNNDFIAFQVFGLNGTKINDPNAVAVGDFVVVYGKLTNFMGNTYETLGKGSAYVWKSTNPLMVETKPEPVEVELLNQDLTTEPSLKAFNIVDVLGEAQTWKIPVITTGKKPTKAKYTQMDGKNTENEDWLVTPELDLTGMSEATLTFESQFTTAVPKEFQKQYTVLVSSTGDIAKAEDWTELPVIPYDSTAFTAATVSLPAEMIGKKCYIAWKYTCQETSHEWRLRNVVVKAMTKVD